MPGYVWLCPAWVLGCGIRGDTYFQGKFGKIFSACGANLGYWAQFDPGGRLRTEMA